MMNDIIIYNIGSTDSFYFPHWNFKCIYFPHWNFCADNLITMMTDCTIFCAMGGSKRMIAEQSTFMIRATRISCFIIWILISSIRAHAKIKC
ncbi:hypothetical protein HanPI659440_Chr03g0123381 [Helianthus annuus]|nr:hypothetical protein HanPI659440_Chr03g0123381 [Helianthus annuus]